MSKPENILAFFKSIMQHENSNADTCKIKLINLAVCLLNLFPKSNLSDTVDQPHLSLIQFVAKQLQMF